MPRVEDDRLNLPVTADPWDVTGGILGYLRSMTIAHRVVFGVDDLPVVLGDVPASTLSAAFARYGAPKSVLIGRRRLYRRADLEAWIAGLPTEAPIYGRRPPSGAQAA